MPALVKSVENVGPTLLGVAISLTVVALATTILRLVVRYHRHLVSWDDYTIAATAALGLGRTMIQIVSVIHGNGKHRRNLSEKAYENVNFLGWLTQLFLFPMLALLKISICLLVVRIKNPDKLRYFLWGVITGLILTNLLPEIVLLAECRPVSAYWKTTQDAKCWPSDVRIYSIYLQTAYGVATDLLCSLLPIYVVWDLQMPLRKKVGIWSLMSLGLISTAFALLRASSLGLKTTDLSWAYAWTATWADIEVYIGIIAANMSLSRMYYGWTREVMRRWNGHPESQERSTYTYNNQAYPMGPFDGSKSNNPVKVRGRRSRRGSHTPSDESKAPLDGINRKVQYSVTKGQGDEGEGEDLEAGPDEFESRDSIIPALPQAYKI